MISVQSTQPLQLSSLEPFAQGGNRLCFVHPLHPDRCVKIRRPDFPLDALRREKGFPKNLKPLASFDDNVEEARVMTALERSIGRQVFRHISQCYGFEETDRGRGLVSELIRNEDGPIASTLKKYLWDFGLTDDCRTALEKLSRFWELHAVPSRDLLLHNLVVQQSADGKVLRIVVIDGLGSASLLPFERLSVRFRRAKARRKTRNLQERVDSLLKLRGTGEFPGLRGLLIHDGTSPGHRSERVKGLW